MKQKQHQKNPRALLAELTAAGDAVEISRAQYDDYGLMTEPAVSLSDALDAAGDEQEGSRDE